MIAPNSLENNLLFQISEVAKLLHKNLSSAFEQNGFNVTPEQFSVLALLWYKEGIKQQEIADELKRDKTTIARIIENMLNSNLIVKVPDQLDKRNNLIYLTKKGKELQATMVHVAGQVYMQALKNITEENIGTGIDILKKIKTNIPQ